MEEQECNGREPQVRARQYGCVLTGGVLEGRKNVNLGCVEEEDLRDKG